MSIKIDALLHREIEDFRNWIRNATSEWVNENQEIILTILSLLLDNKFKRRITHLRKIYKIPKTFYEGNGATFEEFEDWRNKNYKTAPTDIYSKSILNLCDEFNLDPPNRYAFFIYHYLFFSQIFPSELDLGHGNVYSKNEYRYKARLETNAYKLFPQPNVSIREGYIRFFKDTTLNQLISFIKENHREIQRLQENLPSYPHSKKHSRFKRDILVYLYHLLGLKAPEIANVVVDDEEGGKYALSDPEVRQIISYLDLKVKGNHKRKSVNKTH